jgi:primosomal protein N' (replication factor Y)
VQTYTPEHYAIQAAAKHDYAAFYTRERAFRLQLGYPPFARLARLVYRDPDAARCRHAAQELAAFLQRQIEAKSLGHLSLIGPAPCFLSRLRGRWRWQIILRDKRADRAEQGELERLLVSLYLAPGWRLDLDPLDVL